MKFMNSLDVDLWRKLEQARKEDLDLLRVPTRDHRREGYRDSPLATLRELLANTREKRYCPAPCGVYFLIRDRRVVYVGQSVRGMWNRVEAHYKARKKCFDCWSFVACEEHQANFYEKRYIYEFWPEYNRSTKPRDHPKHAWVDGQCTACGVVTLGEPASTAPCPLCDDQTISFPG